MVLHDIFFYDLLFSYWFFLLVCKVAQVKYIYIFLCISVLSNTYTKVNQLSCPRELCVATGIEERMDLIGLNFLSDAIKPLI